MFILIIGGGKIGYYLAKTLLQSGHRIGMVEKDEGRCKALAEDLGITAINGDGTDIDTLREAGVESSKYIVAVTGRDEENLVVCQLAKKYFEAPLTIARVNDPRNQALFRMLGVDATISTTAVAAELIENYLPLNGMKFFSFFQREDIEISEVELKENAPASGKNVAALRLPEECVLIAVVHEGKISFPHGQTVLQSGDRLYTLVKRTRLQALQKILLGGSN
jgi:trk system potassium uptake protein TrkA